VIIIGTGAGGGTLARKLAPTGKRSSCSNAATTSRGKGQLEHARSQRSGKYQTKEVWRDRDGIHCTRTPTTALAATRNSRCGTLPPEAEDFCTVKHHGGVSPAWPSPTMSWNLTTHRRRSITTCTESAARIPPILLPADRTPPSREPRAAHPAVERDSRRGTRPFTPSRRATGREEYPRQQVH
jgi:hypothetical protein